MYHKRGSLYNAKLGLSIFIYSLFTTKKSIGGIILILDGKPEYARMKEKRFFFLIIQFVTVLDLIECLKQISLSLSPDPTM